MLPAARTATERLARAGAADAALPALRRRADLAANWRGTAAGWATTAFMAVRRVVTRCECAVRWNAWVRALYVSGVA